MTKLGRAARAATVAGMALGLTAVSGPLALPLDAASGAPAATATLDRRLTDQRITESSGLARSTYARPIVLTHNDSGDRPRVFAVGPAGRTRAVLTLRGAAASDWEDIATGRGHAVWVGDIGDNARARATVTVYRFREPRILTSRAVAATRFDLRFQDGPRDAEALMVNPRSGRVLVVSKEADGGSVYRAPATLSTTRPNLLRAVAPAPAKVTAGAFGPRGRRYALSTYTRAYLYGSVSDRTARVVTMPKTRQGESLEFAPGGAALLRGSEGVGSPVYRVAVS